MMSRLVVLAVALGFVSQAKGQDVPEGTEVEFGKVSVSVANTDNNGREEVTVSYLVTKEKFTMPKPQWRLGIIPGQVPGANPKGVLIRDIQ